MRRALVLAAVAGVLTLPQAANADGDPASDVLLGQDVFLPYSPISRTHQRELYSIAAAARSGRVPVKIALISSKSDLGVVPALFDKPTTYLSGELGGIWSGPVLVVMPDGFGLASRGKGQTVAALHDISVAPGADGLAAAGLSAVRRLAADDGHPLPAGAADQRSSSGADPATVHRALRAILVLLALAAGSCAAAFALRARRGRELVRREPMIQS